MLFYYKGKTVEDGVTFIELLVTVSVLGILAAIAVPYYGDYIAKQRLTGAAEAIYAMMLQSKRASISNTSTVYFVASSSASDDWCLTYASSLAAVSADCSGGWVTTNTNSSPILLGDDYPSITLTPSSTLTSVGFTMPGLSVSGAQTIGLTSSVVGTVNVTVEAPFNITICSDDLGAYPGC